MPELVQYCDVVMGNIWSANALLGVPLDADIHAKERDEYPTCKKYRRDLAKLVSALQGHGQYLPLRRAAHRTPVLCHPGHQRETVCISRTQYSYL